MTDESTYTDEPRDDDEPRDETQVIDAPAAGEEVEDEPGNQPTHGRARVILTEQSGSSRAGEEVETDVGTATELLRTGYAERASDEPASDRVDTEPSLDERHDAHHGEHDDGA